MILIQNCPTDIPNHKLLLNWSYINLDVFIVQWSLKVEFNGYVLLNLTCLSGFLLVYLKVVTITIKFQVRWNNVITGISFNFFVYHRNLEKRGNSKKNNGLIHIMNDLTIFHNVKLIY